MALQLVSMYVCTNKHCSSVKSCILIHFEGDVDYNSGPYSVRFPPDTTCVPFDVPVINDNILEHNETFSLIIWSTSLPDQVIIGNPRQSTVTIIDDDSK